MRELSRICKYEITLVFASNKEAVNVMKARFPVQARGERRFQRILDAASAEIARVGVGAMSMNAVAIAASTSPGSLYQFFPGKSALLEALAKRFAAQLTDVLHVAGERAVRSDPHNLTELVEAFVIPFAEFYRLNPSYVELYNALNRPSSQIEVELRLDGAIVEQVVGLLQPLVPLHNHPRLQDAARTLLEAAHGVLSGLNALDLEAQSRVEAELKAMFEAYIASLQEFKVAVSS